MTQVMKGVRALELTQFTFVPAAGAPLSDWGAGVIKTMKARWPHSQSLVDLVTDDQALATHVIIEVETIAV